MKGLSICSGIGGLDVACEWAGIETVAFCEIDKFCQKVLRKHWSGVPIYEDMRALTKERLANDGIGTIDVIHGGIPCQPYSENGKKLGSNDERDMWPEMRRIINEINPNWIVIENVEGFLRRGYETVASDLETDHYDVQAYCMAASAFGAEHQRYRVFVVAHFKSKRVERVWTQGEQITYSLDKPLLPLRDSDGQWKVEPDIRRVNDGIPNRMDRIKSLGNSQVPQQIYPILAAIKQIDDMIKEQSA